MTLPLDALGQPIAFGSLYGYTNTSSSWGRAVVGRVSKINCDNGNIRLEVTMAKNYLSGNRVEREWAKEAEAVTIASWRLLPVAEEPAFLVPIT